MDEQNWRTRGYLPHFDQPGLIQGVTFHLWDSIPTHVLKTLASDPEYQEKPVKRERIEAYLNAGHGSCYLKDPSIAKKVQEALLHFDGERYRIYAWVIMPNHVHVLVELNDGNTLNKIIHSWKSYTSLESNKILNRQGKFWFREYFDRYIRNSYHFSNAVRYIHNNPVAAGLVSTPEEYEFSSAKLFTDWRDLETGRFHM